MIVYIWHGEHDELFPKISTELVYEKYKYLCNFTDNVIFDFEKDTKHVSSREGLEGISRMMRNLIDKHVLFGKL